MKSEGRALGESFFLHGLLAGALILLAGALTPPPKTIRLDFTLFDPPPASPRTAAADSPSPEDTAANQPTSQPSPAPSPVQAAATKMLPPQKIHRKRNTNVSPAASAKVVQPDSTPASPPDGGNTAPAAASPEPVAGPSPAAGPPAVDTNPDEEYRRINYAGIRNAVIGNLRYPAIARRRGWNGKVEVAFLITTDGRVDDLRIQTSSGYPLLDEQALEAVRRAAPFAPPRTAALLVMPVTFQLN